MKLYHFTCRHSAKGIRVDGLLKPNPHPLLAGRALVWLTDLDSPLRDDVGLTSLLLSCDRMEYRTVVDCDATRWVDYVRTMPTDLRLAARALTASHGLPMHWYVSETSVTVLELAEASDAAL